MKCFVSSFLFMLLATSVLKADITVGGGATSFTYETMAQIGATTAQDPNTISYLPTMPISSTSALPNGTDFGSSTVPRAIGKLNGSINGGYVAGNPNDYSVNFDVQSAVEGATSDAGPVASSSGIFAGTLVFSSPSPVSIEVDYELFANTFGTQEVAIRDSSSDTFFIVDDNNIGGEDDGTETLVEPAGTYTIDLREGAGDMTSNNGNYSGTTDRASLDATVTVTTVPEPVTGTFVVLAVGLLARRQRPANT